jgi:hypothetical protein
MVICSFNIRRGAAPTRRGVSTNVNERGFN